MYCNTPNTVHIIKTLYKKCTYYVGLVYFTGTLERKTFCPLPEEGVIISSVSVQMVSVILLRIMHHWQDNKRIVSI